MPGPPLNGGAFVEAYDDGTFDTGWFLHFWNAGTVQVTTDPTSPTDPTTPTVTKPDVPTSVGATTTFDAVAVAGTATITWDVPTTDGGSPITGYRVARDGVDTAGAGAYTEVRPATDRSFTFTKLVDGATYGITVAAVNAVGDSDVVLRTVKINSAATVPGLPTSAGVSSTSSSVTMTWQPPTSDGGAAISGYAVSLNGAAPVIVSAAARAHTFGALAASTNHNVSVAAINSVGTGSPVALPVKTLAVGVAPGVLPGLFLARTPTGDLAVHHLPSALPKPLFVPSAPTLVVVRHYDVATASPKPTATNTGPRPGVEMRRVDGNQTFSTAGEVIQGREFFGRVAVTALDVTFRDCIFHGAPSTASTGMVMCTSGTQGNTLFEYCTIDGLGFANEHTNGIMGKSMKLRFCRVRNVVDCVSVMGAGVLVEWSLLEKMAYFTPCSYQSDNQTHNDVFQFHPGATRWMIRSNTIVATYGNAGSHSPTTSPAISHRTGPTPAGQANPDAAAIMFGSNLTPDTLPGNGDIIDNWIDGGYIMVNAGGSSAGINLGRILRNRFGYDAFAGPDEARMHPIDLDATTICDTGSGADVNVYDVSGNPVPVRRNM